MRPETRILIYCSICRKPTYRRPTEINGHNTCSKSCKGKYLSGKRCHLWRGGISRDINYKRNYYIMHKKALNECTKNYYIKHREEIREKELIKRHSLGISKNYIHTKRSSKPKTKSKPIIKNGKEYHPDWNNLRKQIYKRDSWICQECNIKCTDAKHNAGKSLIQCHHIDYNTKNNSFDNLITLCNSCHAKTKWDRNDWIKYFQSKMKGKQEDDREATTV